MARLPPRGLNTRGARFARRLELKRLSLVLPVLVFGALFGVLFARRWREPEPPRPPFATPRTLGLAPLAAPAGGAALSGVVVDEEGKAVAEASIVLRSGGMPFWTSTGSDGRFRLEGLHPEESDALVLAWGWPPSSHRVTPGASEVSLVLPPRSPPPPALPDVVRAPLSGSIVPALPAPANAALAYELVLTPSAPPEAFGGAVPRRLMTADDGSFRIEDLALGRYRIAVLPAWARGGSWPDLAAGAAELDHARGASDLRVELAAGAIEARVIDTSGRAVEGALVLVEDAHQPAHLWPPLATAPDGSFRIDDLPPGTFTVSVRAGEGEMRGAEVPVDVGRVARPDLPPLQIRR